MSDRGGWLVTNPNINFAHYFSGPELSPDLKAVLGRKHMGSRCGATFDPRSIGQPAAWPNDPDREPSKVCGRCLRSALTLVPDAMRRDLKAQDGRFAAETIERFLRADETTRADMLAFHESEGPEKTRQAKAKHKDGTPTVADLEAALEASCEPSAATLVRCPSCVGPARCSTCEGARVVVKKAGPR